jgi:superfamily I DNA/RNA helicase
MPLSLTYRCKSRIVKYVHKQYESESHAPEIEAFEKGGQVIEITGTKNDEYRLDILLENKVEMIVSAKNKHIISIWFNLLEQYGISSSLKGSNITTMLTKMIKNLKSNGIQFINIYSELHSQTDNPDEAIADMAAACLRFVSLQKFTSYEQVLDRIKKIENDTTSKIHLHTIHSAKGMEADKVFVIDDFFDSTQKKNMQYVAFTRAADELYVVSLPKQEEFVPPTLDIRDRIKAGVQNNQAKSDSSRNKKRMW